MSGVLTAMIGTGVPPVVLTNLTLATGTSSAPAGFHLTGDGILYRDWAQTDAVVGQWLASQRAAAGHIFEIALAPALGNWTVGTTGTWVLLGSGVSFRTAAIASNYSASLSIRWRGNTSGSIASITVNGTNTP
jgi:hypothetical protein